MELIAIISREGNLYASLCPELNVASQGDSVEEAQANLKEALELFFEGVHPNEIKTRLKSDIYSALTEWDLSDHKTEIEKSRARILKNLEPFFNETHQKEIKIHFDDHNHVSKFRLEIAKV